MATVTDADISGKYPPGKDTELKRLWNRYLIRIGHGGAAGRAPTNTLKSLATAIELGVDMVEFDVRPCLDEIVLLHDDSLSDLSGGRGLASQSTLEVLRTLDAGDGEPIATLKEALEFVKGKALVNLDLKTYGIEAHVIRMLQSMNLTGDVMISSLNPKSLIKVRELAPALKTAISYPKDRGNASARLTLKPVVWVALKLLRSTMQYRVLGMMENAQADAAMLHFSIISPEAVQQVHEAEGLVFAWTVDDLPTLRHVRSMGVDGIASNYPELFKEVE